MMKKRYMQPTIAEVKIALTGMLASSPTGGHVYGDAPGGSSGFSRGNSWDDDEE